MPYIDPNSVAAKASLAMRGKRYRQNHPERVRKAARLTQRDRWYKCEHGISEAAFEAQIVAQGGLCPIGLHPFGPRGKHGDSPCQDHNHETGENRAILCRNHNVMLGLANDNPEILAAAILYLQKYKK
jgi:hypothetical protein